MMMLMMPLVAVVVAIYTVMPLWYAVVRRRAPLQCLSTPLQLMLYRETVTSDGALA